MRGRSRIKWAARYPDGLALESFSPCVLPFAWPGEGLTGLGRAHNSGLPSQGTSNPTAAVETIPLIYYTLHTVFIHLSLKH